MRIPADIQFLHDVLAYVRSQALQAGLCQLEAKRVELACEEIIVNIITYAYSDREGTIDLQFQEAPPGHVRIEITDDGPPFDPLTVQADPDLELPLENRPEGGLGLFLVRQIVDDLTYSRQADRNIVTLTKKSQET